MNTTPDAILFEDRDDGIAILRLNSPATLNALTRESVALLNERLDAIAQTTSVRAVVLTGVGRGFCAGQDVGVAKTRGDGSGLRISRAQIGCRAGSHAPRGARYRHGRDHSGKR